MSKSLGNSPNPLDLIAQYGADSVRVGMLLSSPAGNDLIYDESLIEQGRNFASKIWNAFRLVKSWEVDESIEQPKSAKEVTDWFENKLNETISQLDNHYSKYRISDALMLVYKLFWDEFSSWYLEGVKPAYQQPIDKQTYDITVSYFERLLQVLHPFMPFITEELWQQISERKAGESITISLLPKDSSYNAESVNNFELTKELITGVRNVRTSKNISFKEQIELFINSDNDIANIETVIKFGNISKFEKVSESVQGAISFMVKTTEFYIPLNDNIDKDAEIAKLTEEIKYQEGFLNSVMKKLSNERFVNNAPTKVVEIEKAKQADAENKIQTLKAQIEALK